LDRGHAETGMAFVQRVSAGLQQTFLNEQLVLQGIGILDFAANDLKNAA
jgi:hypothetical protein